MKKHLLFVLMGTFIVATIGSFSPARSARAATLTFTIMCSSITLTISGAPVGFSQDLAVWKGSNPRGPHLASVGQQTVPASGSLIITVTFPEQPEGTVLYADTAGSVFGGPYPRATGPCGKVSGNAIQFFNPGDGRVEPRPGDRIAVWCNIAGDPPAIDVWAVGSDSRGFRLTTFKFADLVVAGPKGLTQDLGRNGKLSAMVDDQNNFYVAWNGGPFGATGRDSFAKTFNCAFKR
jgi:hypothetical protein